MKKITLILAFAFVSTLGFSQLKVFMNGDVAVNSTGTQPRAFLDVNENSSTRNTVQFGTFGIQSFSNNNGILCKNGFWNGSAMEHMNNGGLAMLQLQAGKVYFRTSPTASGGTTVTNGNLNNNIVAVPTGRVGIMNANPAYELDVTGNAYKSLGGDLWNMASDKRLKNDIQDFDSGLDYIMKMNPVDYTYNGKAGTTDGEYQIGVVAQELQKFAPFMVSEFTHTIGNDNVLIDENAPVKEETFLSINASAVKWMLVDAVQEQQKLLEEKDARIEKLEESIKELADIVKDIKANGIAGGVNEIEVDLTNVSKAVLNQNRPNPFNGTTIIDYVIPSDSKSSLINIYNIDGKKMKSVTINHVGQGELTVNAYDLPAGTYTYELVVNGKSAGMNKMVLSK